MDQVAGDSVARHGCNAAVAVLGAVHSDVVTASSLADSVHRKVVGSEEAAVEEKDLALGIATLVAAAHMEFVVIAAIVAHGRNSLAAVSLVHVAVAIEVDITVVDDRPADDKGTRLRQFARSTRIIRIALRNRNSSSRWICDELFFFIVNPLKWLFTTIERKCSPARAFRTSGDHQRQLHNCKA